MSKSLDKVFQKDYWEHNANTRDYKHPVVKEFVQQRIGWIRHHIPLDMLKSAYDVGCGDGFATYYFDKLIPEVHGGDISEYMLSLNPLPKDRLEIIDAENLPLSRASFDLVYTWEVLHHVPNPQRAVTEMARVSKKYVVIFEPNRNNPLQFLFGLLNKQERGTLRSSKRYIENLVKTAGLRIISCEYVGKIPPNKSPTYLIPFLKRLPFKSNLFTGISIAVVAEKT